MTAPVLQFKRGLLANLPGLRAGEPGFTTDSYDLYVGIDSSLVSNKFFGSHRYWTKETTSTGSGINVVEGTSNGSSYITLKSPDSLAGIVTYTLPGTDGTTNQVLATNGSGTLSFIDAVASLDIAGDTGVDTVNLLTDTFSIIGTTAEIVTAVTNNQVQIGLPDNVIVGASLTVTGVLDVNGGADISGGETVLSSATVSDLTSGRVILAGTSGALEDSGNLTFDGSTLTVTGEIVVNSGISTFTGLIDANDGLDVLGHTELDNVNVSGIITAANVVFGSGTAITSVDTDLSTVSTSDDTLASAKAIKTYVDALVTAQDLDFAGDTGTGAVDLDSQTFTVAGTVNEIVTSASGQTITIGLPDAVTVTTSLTTPTVNATNLNANDGTTALTVADSTGAVTAANDLTVQGNLYVSGNTTQVNTAALTVEDRTIDLGIVNGAAPASATTWDLGVLFNYNSGGAKKSAVIWEHSDTRFKFASVLGADTNGTDNNTPQLSVTTFAPIEIGSLWVTDCAGTSQVISCTGTERFLENITVDAGTF